MIVSLLGSRGVATEVTHPEWPFSTPRKESVSARVAAERAGWGGEGDLARLAAGAALRRLLG